MARALYKDRIDLIAVSGALSVAAGATVEVRQAGTATPVASVYAGPTGGTTLANPFTLGADAGFLFYLDMPAADVDLYIVAAGYAPSTLRARPVPDGTSLADLTTTQTLSGKTLSSPTLNNPTISGGSWASPTLTTPTLTSPTITNPTVTNPTISGGSLAGGLTADLVLTPPSDDGAFKLRTTGSGATTTGTFESPRDALVWLRDTNESSIDSAALVVDVREDVAGSSVTRSGIHAKIWSRLDRGESSAILAVQSGGGGTLTGYATTRMRPAGKPDLSFSPQGVIEVATDNMSQAILARSGLDYPEQASAPWPTLTGAMTNAQTTVPVSDVALLPTPGGAVPTGYAGAGITTWPTPLYVRIGRDPLNPTATPGETISYTGKSAASGAGNLTGCVRGINSTATSHAGGVAATHSSGDKVEPLNANNAMLLTLVTPVSKGIVIQPYDGLSYDGRPALTIGTQVRGAPAETSVKLAIALNGDINSVGTITASTALGTAQLNATNAGVTGTLTTADATAGHLIGSGSTPSIAAGAGAGTSPTVAVSGADLAGVVTVTTGTTPTANAVVATITFARAFAAAPKAVIMRPANTAARALSGTSEVWIDVGSADIAAGSWRFRANVALAASTAYQWYFIVAG